MKIPELLLVPLLAFLAFLASGERIVDSSGDSPEQPEVAFIMKSTADQRGDILALS